VEAVSAFSFEIGEFAFLRKAVKRKENKIEIKLEVAFFSYV